MNGKGSARRGASRAETERYRKGWDRIFRKPRKSRSAHAKPQR